MSISMNNIKCLYFLCVVHIFHRVKYLLSINNMLVEDGEYRYIEVLFPAFWEFIA